MISYMGILCDKKKSYLSMKQVAIVFHNNYYHAFIETLWGQSKTLSMISSRAQ